MGRKRTICREALLDAVARVVTRDGATRLTLEAVATEAGISKASVLYDFGNKSALIRALIERKVAEKEGDARRVAESLGGAPNAVVHGRIALAADPVSNQDRAMTFGLLAALAQEEELCEPIRQAYSDVLCDIRSTSQNPRGAMLAFLALEGLRSMEWLGLHSWAPEERATLLSEIGWLVEQRPDAPRMSKRSTE
ncbi:TetR/AcrR family transcriptional regulator [Stappia sp.]|jgi:AcrR family transcriptional regulator|uniref:TetR/AcrR family transcriptional regulator n=1 Tax=Stappia sp. TaxID=1870903 RepID=UPI003A999AC9